MCEKDFEKFIEKLCGTDIGEINIIVDESIRQEVLKRPHFKLNNDLTYIKNSYDYSKKTPIHYLNPNPDFTFNRNNEKIEEYQRLKKQKDLTTSDEKYLESISWIKDYIVFLDCFDFNEFNTYYSNSKSGFMETSLNFLNLHYTIGLEKNDYRRLFDTTLSKALYHIMNNEYMDALVEELKLFLLRLNPSCNSDELIFHEAVNRENISNLNNLIEYCNIEDINRLFNEIWDLMEFKRVFFKKDESYMIFIKALEITDFDKLNCEIEEKYFS